MSAFGVLGDLSAAAAFAFLEGVAAFAAMIDKIDDDVQERQDFACPCFLVEGTNNVDTALIGIDQSYVGGWCLKQAQNLFQKSNRCSQLI